MTRKFTDQKVLVYLREKTAKDEYPAELCIKLVRSDPDTFIKLPVNRKQLINMLDVGIGILRRIEDETSR
tara:strand:+ start:261 stop:470 length:210 start_codon:yes stop_codon:yes gene_type:complete